MRGRIGSQPTHILMSEAIEYAYFSGKKYRKKNASRDVGGNTV